jgi:hypothetical protein
MHFCTDLAVPPLRLYDASQRDEFATGLRTHSECPGLIILRGTIALPQGLKLDISNAA